MKRHFILIFIINIVFFNHSMSQEGGSLRISFATHIMSTPYDELSGYGISIEIFVSPSVAFDYQYLLGNNSDGDHCYYFPGSMAAMLFLFGEELYLDPYFYEENDWIWFTLLIPDGISLHTYPRKWIEIAPFIHPLAGDFNLNGGRTPGVSLEFGFRTCLKPLPWFSVAPLFALRKNYSEPGLNHIVGLHTGFLF
ncbi:MAG: hypothetical protein JW861_00025 [Bacteroidales bacterium]|nr:hypothetical protein [Bacteroidales bacterium]